MAGRVVRHLGAVEVEEGVRSNLVPLPKCASRKAPIRSRSGHRSEYTSCWLSVLQLIPRDSVALHKRVLSLLDDTVIPSMTRPQLLGDYLIDAYNTGGIISLLALSSLFTLIRKHNLDYPDFFPKLYSLLDGRILHIYYRRRFLRLLDMFMQSTMLPAYIVAAFAKRTARLALYAPAPSVQWVVPFVYNLLKRHPACRVMIHRDEITMRNDPFDPDTLDLSSCGALDSSLWELQSLTRHYWGPAARQASIFADRFTKPPFDLEKVLNDSSFTHEEIVADELSHRWSKRPPTNLDIPSSAFD
jgi:U3 small nucleolar RNA-associated protein 19